MLLKKGITGFYNIKESAMKMNDYRDFRKICYSLQNAINHKIIDTFNYDYTSYFCAEFDDGIYFLVNKYYTVAGFTEDILHGDKIFIDNCCNGIYLPEYKIIPASILNSDFSRTENELSDCELKQIKYYSPVSVGNIIFNEWD